MVGPLVQLVRTLPCHGRGHGFEFHTDRREGRCCMCAREKGNTYIASCNPTFSLIDRISYAI